MVGTNCIKTLALAALCWAAAAWAGVDVEPRLRLAAEERYDDDVLVRTAAGTGQLMTKISPQAGLDLADETLTFKSFYALDLLVHHGSGTTGLDHRGGLDVKKLLTRTLELDAKAQVWRVSDPTSLPRLGLARTYAPILYGKASLAAKKDLSERWQGTLGYRFEGAQVYEADRLPGFAHAPYAQTWFKASRRTELGLEYRYQLFTYGPERSNAHGAFAGYRYQLTRQTTFTAQAGPVFYVADDGTQGLLPRVSLELGHEAGRLELGAALGHDLVGASGFTSAVWADFASLVAGYHFSQALRAFGAASYYRNGKAPNTGVIPGQVDAVTGLPTTTQGYALGLGLEWRFLRQASLQGSFDRIAQVGAVDAAGLALTRNIAAVRLIVEAL